MNKRLSCDLYERKYVGQLSDFKSFLNKMLAASGMSAVSIGLLSGLERI